ncbi:MFS transporter [Actinoplanes sp. NPDC000266]
MPALLWGFQFAFLNPALALLLVVVFDAGAGEVGWALAVYNAGGFVASLLLPAYADRRRDYVRPMLACGVLTLALALRSPVRDAAAEEADDAGQVPRGPVVLLGAQILNAWFFAVVAGVGLTLFQDLVPRPGLAAGLYANTRRLGAVAAGPLIGLGAVTPLGYSGVFLTSGVITAVAAAGLLRVSDSTRKSRHCPPATRDGCLET